MGKVCSALLLTFLATSVVQAHVRLLDPVARSDDSGLTEGPCGGIPAGSPVATYVAGTEIEITVNLAVQHVPFLKAVISYDNFATQSQLALRVVPGEGEYKMTVPLPAQPLGAAILQVTDDTYVTCADITLTDEPPFKINAGLSDAWFNSATNGQGFLVVVFPVIEEIFLAWFTYETERPPESVTASLGEPGHRWLTAQGPYSGDTARLKIFVTEGGVFDSAEPVASTDPAGDGAMTLEFAGCTEGLVKYEITSLGISGEIPIERISADNVALCNTLHPGFPVQAE
jgi:hypothetical protein